PVSGSKKWSARVATRSRQSSTHAHSISSTPKQVSAFTTKRPRKEHRREEESPVQGCGAGRRGAGRPDSARQRRSGWEAGKERSLGQRLDRRRLDRRRAEVVPGRSRRL